MTKTRFLTALLVAVLTVCGACSKSENHKAQRPAPLPPDSQGTVEQLVGTSWRADEFEVTFNEPPNCLIKGGSIEEMAPEGIDGEYTLADGILEVTAMDETYFALWHGDRLVVDGEDAVPLQ